MHMPGIYVVHTVVYQRGLILLTFPAETATPRVAFADHAQADDEMGTFEWPSFGVSPGPTPSPSTPSCNTPSDFDVSDVSRGYGYQSCC